MSKRKTEMQKVYDRTVVLVERYMKEGMNLTMARNTVQARVGLGYNKMVELTKHLSPRRPYPTEEE